MICVMIIHTAPIYGLVESITSMTSSHLVTWYLQLGIPFLPWLKRKPAVVACKNFLKRRCFSSNLSWIMVLILGYFKGTKEHFCLPQKIWVKLNEFDCNVEVWDTPYGTLELLQSLCCCGLLSQVQVPWLTL